MESKKKIESVSIVTEQIAAQHSGISMAIVQSISKLLDNRQLEDFKVTVDDDAYSCHSCILAACSDFFSGLLQSQMKEKREMKVHLNNISSPIFQLILKTLYTGVDLLTANNVLEVWSAVHQLQIHFLIQHCEDFVMNNLSLDNLEMYKERAEYLQSEKVCEYIFNFILENFSSVRETELYLHLDLQYLTKLLRNDRLVVNSEDEVLYSILDWVKFGNNLTQKVEIGNNLSSTELACVVLTSSGGQDSTNSIGKKHKPTLELNVSIHTPPKEKQNSSINDEEPNERQKFLFQLLNQTRYYLASESCIFSLYKHKLVQNDIPVRECLLEAYPFKFCNKWHNYCPSKSIHRDSCGIENVGVFCDKGYVSAFSFKNEKWVSLKHLPCSMDAKLTILKGKLYACETHGISKCLLVFDDDNKWVVKRYIMQSFDLLLSHGHFIYMLTAFARQMIQLNPETAQFKTEYFSHPMGNITYALVHNNSIVVFSSISNKGVEETAVRSWNTETKVWTTFNNLQLCSKNMASFCDYRDMYILECNGNLWKLTDPKTFGFRIVAELWNEKHIIKGALLFRESLFIFGHFPNEDHKNADIGALDGVFTSAKFWNVALTASNLTHYVMQINDIRDNES